MFESAKDQHAATDRVARANLLQTAIDLAHHEQGLVAANKESFTSARAREIDADSTRLMQLLRAADHAWGQGRPMRGLSSKYGAAILLADSPSRARKATASLAAVASAASSALAAERVDALADQPREGILVDIEIGAAALAAIEGPLLLFWVVRRHRRRVERHHQRRVDQLSAQARTDTLTRLGNRRAFEDDLGITIASASRDRTALHAAGDRPRRARRRSTTEAAIRPATLQIRKVADCLREVVGADGGVYRTGGDEFMVILPGPPALARAQPRGEDRPGRRAPARAAARSRSASPSRSRRRVATSS